MALEIKIKYEWINIFDFKITTYIVLLLIIFVIYKLITCETNKERVNALKIMVIVFLCLQLFHFLSEFLSAHISFFFSFVISSVIATTIAIFSQKYFIKE